MSVYRLYRAELTARVLMRRSGEVPGFVWPQPRSRWDWRTGKQVFGKPDHRRPPLPFYLMPTIAGQCRVCGQPIYGTTNGASYRRPGEVETSRHTWHRACLTAYNLWTNPNGFYGTLLAAQSGRCPSTGQEIGGDGEVDHTLPLYRVAREHAHEPWWMLIRFWGLANLRVLSLRGHREKSAAEAGERRRGPHADLFELINSATTEQVAGEAMLTSGAATS